MIRPEGMPWPASYLRKSTLCEPTAEHSGFGTWIEIQAGSYVVFFFCPHPTEPYLFRPLFSSHAQDCSSSEYLCPHALEIVALILPFLYLAPQVVVPHSQSRDQDRPSSSKILIHRYRLSTFFFKVSSSFVLRFRTDGELHWSATLQLQELSKSARPSL